MIKPTQLKNSHDRGVGECFHFGIKIDLGCGRGRDRDMLGIDANPGEQVDYVRDLSRGLPFCNRSVEVIKAHNVLEHIEGTANFEYLMRECWRVLKDGGLMDIVVPGAYSDGGMRDPTHTRHFTKSTFDYFKRERPRFHEWLPDTPWILLEVKGENDGTICVKMTPDRGTTPPLPSPTETPENGENREGIGGEGEST
jgi:SAM-dependent methyltransferase